MQLGSRVSTIRDQGIYVKGHPERRAELDALGFVWDDLKRRWEEARAALLAYQQLQGDLEVPIAFVVPSEAPWPEETWGLRLGNRVHDIRGSETYVKGHPERRAELDALGFVWDDVGRRWATVHAALRAFKGVHGHLRVPAHFLVPTAPPWPEEVRGLKLGGRVSKIRLSEHFVKDHPERRAALDALGFVWRPRAQQWGQVRAALLAYRGLHGHLQVPYAFVVPAAAPWPEELWELKLGLRAHSIRAQETYVKDHPERRLELDAMGFVWDALRPRWEHARDALRAYKQVHGNLEVPYAFVVPPESPWPEETWGVQLGSKVNNIRCASSFIKGHPQRRRELSELGFRWGDPAHWHPQVRKK